MRFLSILLCVLTSSCAFLLMERDYGVKRGATLDHLPDRACVNRSLHEIKEIQEITELHHGSDLSSFVYEGHGFWANLGWRVDGNILFFQDSVSVNRRPSARQIETTRRMMRLVEQRLSSECGMQELAGNVHEDCLRVKCPE